MNLARINHARLLMVAWRAFRQWVEPGPLNQARSHFNRMLKKSFSVEKTCKKPIVLVGRFPETAIFQQPVKWFVVGHLKMLTVGIVEYLKEFSRLAYLKILLAYTTCFVASNGLAPAYGQVNNAPELYYFVIDKSRSIVENLIRGAGIDFVGRRSLETHVEIVFFRGSLALMRARRIGGKMPLMDKSTSPRFALAVLSQVTVFSAARQSSLHHYDQILHRNWSRGRPDISEPPPTSANLTPQLQLRTMTP